MIDLCYSRLGVIARTRDAVNERLPKKFTPPRHWLRWAGSSAPLLIQMPGARDGHWSAELLFPGHDDPLHAWGTVFENEFVLYGIDVAPELREQITPEVLALRLHHRIAPQHEPVMMGMFNDAEWALASALRHSHGWKIVGRPTAELLAA